MKRRWKILFAYDGSECAAAALEDLHWAGLPRATEAVVLTVVDVWGPPAEPAAYERSATELDLRIRSQADELRRQVRQSTGEARGLAAQASERLQAMFPTWQVKAEACVGAPAWELIKKADQWQPDLLVVGSQGRGAIERILLGSVSQKVLNEARCSVRIARRQVRTEGAPVRVLLAIDGSPSAEAAARAVAAREWAAGTEVRLLIADDPFNIMGAGYIGWNYETLQPDEGDKMAGWMNRIFEAPARILREAGLMGLRAIRWGDARQVILDEAAQWQADCIFTGARGVGRFHRFLLGSVSAAVAARAACSVEVVRNLAERPDT